MGNLASVETTGASQRTAQQDKRGYSVLRVNIMRIDTTGAYGTAKENELEPGVPASEEMAGWDLERICRYSDVIEKVAKERDIDPAVIAAIISRDHIQDNSEEDLRKVTNKLAKCIGAMPSDYPTWTKEEQFKGGIVAYTGKRIGSREEPDEYTEGEDYSNDVVARAQWFRRTRHF